MITDSDLPVKRPGKGKSGKKRGVAGINAGPGSRVPSVVSPFPSPSLSVWPRRRRADEPEPAAPNAQSGEFQRIEDKVLLSNQRAERLLEDVNRHMKPSYFHNGTKFTLIASYYFDGPELNFFQHHFRKLPTRYKLRIRRYAPNGVWNDGEASLIELKVKESGVSQKKRFALTKANYDRVMAGRPLEMSGDLLALNPRITEEKLSKRLKKINGLIVKFGLKPMLKVQYKRFAFESQSFRLTMDRNLKTESLFNLSDAVRTHLFPTDIWPMARKMAGGYDRLRHCIVELKHSGRLPRWVERFIEEHKIQRTRFSKYCWAIAQQDGGRLQ